MILLTGCCLLAIVLLIWFKSNAFVEYAKLLGIQNYFFIPLFEGEKEKDPSLDYIEYLSLHHECFFVRLISCVLCLGFWIALLICLLLSEFMYVEAILFKFPIIYLGGLILYGTTSKVLE